MRSIEAVIGEEGGAGGQFHRLPDDVVLHIFNKVLDAKWLCRCFVVCKRFASLIPHLHTVSLILPPSLASDFPHANFFRKLKQIFNSLHKLEQIRSLHVELPSNVNFVVGCGELFKWGAKFSTQIDCVTLLYGTSLCAINQKSEEEEKEGEREPERDIALQELKRRIRFGKHCIKDAGMRLAILMCVIPQLPTLVTVVFTDSEKKGAKLCLSGAKLAEFRNPVDVRTMSQRLEEVKQKKMRVGYVPVLHLQNYGYVMKGVMVATIQLFAGDDYDEEMTMLGAFEEEEDAFWKVAVQKFLETVRT